jgi:hypothetical protein
MLQCWERGRLDTPELVRSWIGKAVLEEGPNSVSNRLEKSLIMPEKSKKWRENVSKSPLKLLFKV